jgi:hypothetical protein
MAGHTTNGVERTVDREDLERMLREAARGMGAGLPRRLTIALRPLAEAFFRTTARGGELRVVINDAFASAPREVLEGLAEVIVAKTTRLARPRSVGVPFWEYLETEPVRERIGPSPRTPQGLRGTLGRSSMP